MNKKVIFLASGNGGTLRFLYYAIRVFNLPLEVNMLIADRICVASQFAMANHIDYMRVNYSSSNDKELSEILGVLDVDVIITNIHKILTPRVLNSTQADFINLHYSILPAFAGLIGMKTVEEAKKQNCQFLGATCHEVTEKLDGGRILCQGLYPVNWSDPVDIIHDKVFRIACICLLNGILGKYYESPHKFQTEYGTFNPVCQFDVSLLDEEFWKKIKTTN